MWWHCCFFAQALWAHDFQTNGIYYNITDSTRHTVEVTRTYPSLYAYRDTVVIPDSCCTIASITGVSGSGKSSRAFDSLYAEGQRRYVESLSSYARQFMERMGNRQL